MIEEEFFLQECYSLPEQAIYAQDRMLTKFALFCGKLYTHRLKLESATIKRGTVLGIHCIKIEGKVSGRAEDVAAMMVGGTIA